MVRAQDTKLMQALVSSRLNRRDVMQRSLLAGAGIASAGVLTAPGVSAAANLSQSSEGVEGGRLSVAIIGEPPTLDEHQTTASVVADITFPMYETLFTYGEGYTPIPHLVDEYTLSEDGLTHTLKLREGVPFHNGEIMSAADVHASVMRWSAISGVGKKLFEVVDEFAEVDDSTVEFRLSKPFGPFLIAFSHNTQACTIHPKSILDAAGDAPLSSDDQFVGTGPYYLSERRADAYIRLARFDDYASRDEPINGYGGGKQAWVDEIEFLPVPDEAARTAGLQAGDYHIVTTLSNDQFTLLKDASGVIAEIRQPATDVVFFLNWRSPLMGNSALRQAFQAALDHEAIMTAAFGGADFFQLDAGWMFPQTQWHTSAGEELYNIHDPELAKQKLEEAGYDGTPLRFMTTQEYPTFYDASIIAQQQLEEVGFVIDLQVTDWATIIERRGQEDAWDVFSTSHGFVPDPSQLTLVGQMGIYPGWWDSEESLALADELLGEPDFDAAYSIWESIQSNIYSEVPAIKVGNASDASYYRDNVGGWVQQVERGIPYWNLWIDNA
ncbi:MAG TPA: ABC transporter substrate-binding protein [Thermomicrobiales bacterium]|nr:ABC transporter substrate-binding protein [Thermomicrobiales bacterium]